MDTRGLIKCQKYGNSYINVGCVETRFPVLDGSVTFWVIGLTMKMEEKHIGTNVRMGM